MNNNIYNRILIAFILISGLPGAFAQSNAVSQNAGNDQPVIQLGKIQVKGEKQIIKVLQSIKIALRQPYSSDPRLANVVVCRIENDIGSHAKQLLVCGTNRTLAKRRDRIQTALTVMLSAPTPGGEQAEVSVLQEMLESLPDNYLHAPVNGPALRALLKKIPDPPPSRNQAAPDTNTGNR